MDFNVVIVVVCAAHGLLLVAALLRGRAAGRRLLWLSAVLAFAMLICASYLLPADVQLPVGAGRSLVLGAAVNLTVMFYGILAMSDISRASSRKRLVSVWLGVALVWLVGFVGGSLLTPTAAFGQEQWLIALVQQPDLPSLTLVIGCVLSTILLLGVAFSGYYDAVLPEVANRALFWVVNSAVLVIGIITLLSTSVVPLQAVGMLLLLVAMAGATYSQLAHRIIDIRVGFAHLIRFTLLASLTALVIFGATSLADRSGSADERALTLIVAAVLLALAYVPVRMFVEFILNKLLVGRRVNPTLATRQFSQQVTRAVDLEPLIETTTTMVNRIMRVRRSGILLVNDSGGESGQMELLVMVGGGFANMKGVRGWISTDSPIYRQLAVKQDCLLQFDLQYDLDYADIAPAEREFFTSLQMSAYAPIVVENVLIGVLACGTKTNDSAFYSADLELLTTMGHQTGIALRNSRLVADLRHLNKTMQVLNNELENTNDELGKLDSVKTDFVTIASHELRTPLAQLRGYTDIIDALNEQGMLDQDQVGGLVANLRKATERMEELISAMLDVSQLDVNAMDLRFTQTTPEAVLRLAIEPLTNEIKQRKLSLSMRGTRGLPPIQADMQRLVQAFRAVVTNAIKFTPDGGKIEIRASLKPSERLGDVDHILVEIMDSGVGIAQEHLTLIFNKFFRAADPSLHSTGAFKFMGAGPGLGLTIAKGVIEGHGGEIWAESPGHDMKNFPGSTFYILLPVSPPEDARRVLPFGSDEVPAVKLPTT